MLLFQGNPHRQRAGPDCFLTVHRTAWCVGIEAGDRIGEPGGEELYHPVYSVSSRSLGEYLFSAGQTANFSSARIATHSARRGLTVEWCS